MNVNMHFSPSYFSHIHFLFNPSPAFNFFLLNLECIRNRVLLYSTGYYIQVPGINHNEKEYQKRMYICIKRSHLAI